MVCHVGNELSGRVKIVVVMDVVMEIVIEVVMHVVRGGMRGLVVVEGGGFFREEIISTIIEHGGGEFTHDRSRLEVKVSHHGVAMSAAEHADGVVIDSSIEKGHGASSA
jgi:hypothetical protein